MREEHKLNKAIKQDGVDTQSEILDRLKLRYPQYAEQSANKKAPVRKRKFAAILAFAVIAVCAAVIIPCSVLLPYRNDGSGDGGKDNDRYCTQDEYEKIDVQYTIGEYRVTNDRNFLYFDWYEYGEDCETICYISKADNEVLCLEEQAYLPEQDESVQLSITKANIFLSVFEATISNCKSEQIVNDHAVKWVINQEAAICIFVDNGYRYFIRIKQGQDENRLFELVIELLETK